MNLSNEPVVWRTALGAIISAGVTVGVLAQPVADQIGGGLDALVISANALIPVIAGLFARAKVRPVATDKF